MADKKFTDLPEELTPTSDDVLAIVDITTDVSKKVTVANLGAGALAAADTDDLAEGSTNKYYTEAKVSANTAVAANTAKVGVTTEISNVSEDTTPQLGGSLDMNGKNIFIIPSSTFLISAGDSSIFNGTNWAPTDASAESTSKGMAGIYDGTNIIIKGPYTTTGLIAGDVYYLSETGGTITNVAPTTSLSIVRPFGYALSTTVLFIDPDKTWVENA